MYRPLPPSVTVRQSVIDGLGLFATKDIASGTDLGVTHVYDQRFENRYVRTPLGGFINHSKEPNAKLIGCKESRDIDCGILHLQLIKDVKSGDEITTQYSLYEVDVKDITVNGVEIIAGTEAAYVIDKPIIND